MGLPDMNSRFFQNGLQHSQLQQSQLAQQQHALQQQGQYSLQQQQWALSQSNSTTIAGSYPYTLVTTTSNSQGLTFTNGTTQWSLTYEVQDVKIDEKGMVVETSAGNYSISHENLEKFRKFFHNKNFNDKMDKLLGEDDEKT